MHIRPNNKYNAITNNVFTLPTPIAFLSRPLYHDEEPYYAYLPYTTLLYPVFLVPFQLPANRPAFLFCIHPAWVVFFVRIGPLVVSNIASDAGFYVDGVAMRSQMPRLFCLDRKHLSNPLEKGFCRKKLQHTGTIQWERICLYRA